MIVSEKDDFERSWPNDLGFDTVRENSEAIELTVEGHIPDYVSGTIYQNGPGASSIIDEDGFTRYQVSHWFDGFALLHKYELIARNGRIDSIKYSSRFNVDTLMEEAMRSGNLNSYTFAQRRDPCMSLFRKVMSLFMPIRKLDLATNVAVTVSANSTAFPAKCGQSDKGSLGHKTTATPVLVVRTDAAEFKALDPSTLEPVGIAHQADLHPLLTGPLSAAHARSDPETGDSFNYNLDFGRFATYRVFKVSPDGETEVLATIAASGVQPAYMHSFFLSENFVILCVWSAHLALGGLRVLWEKNIMDSMSPFDDTKRARWFVIDRRHGRGVVAQFDSDAAFCFHTINAFEDVNVETGQIDLSCDLIEYDNLDIFHKFYYENLKSSSPHAREWMNKKQPGAKGHYARYLLSNIPAAAEMHPLTKCQREAATSLPQPRTAVRIKTIPSPMAGELPKINPRFVCQPYHYYWNTTFSDQSTFTSGLSKVDVVTGEAISWDGPRGHSPGEALFIPRSEDSAEDDGVVMSVVLDGFRGSSYLVCLDASTMKELGRADCGGPISFAFHGQHLSSSGRRPVDV